MKGQVIMSLSALENVYNQACTVVAGLEAKFKEHKNANSNPQTLQDNLKKRKLTPEEIFTRKFGSDQAAASSEKLETFRYEPDMKLLQYETDHFTQEGFSFEISKKDSGIQVICRSHLGEKIIKIPQDYPSTAPLLVKHPDQGKQSTEENTIYGPNTLTALVRMLSASV